MNWNEIFEYKDGKIYWLLSPRARTNIGDEAGCLSKSGYISISVQEVEEVCSQDYLGDA